MTARRILVAGIGNVFMGDDGFGVAVAQRLAGRPRRRGVVVMDAGIRGIDLAYALVAGYDAAILVDVVDRAGPPGTLYVIDPDAGEGGRPAPAALLDAHEMDPARVLAVARSLGGAPEVVRIVGCRPETLGSPEDPVLGLSECIEAAVPAAIELVDALLLELCGEQAPEEHPGGAHA